MMRVWRSVRTLHLVLGLGAGLLVVLTGLTGSILAFQGEIDRALNPSLWRVEPSTGLASLERIREAVEASQGPPIRMLLLPDRPDRAMLALQMGRDRQAGWEVFVDPHHAKILGRRRYGSSAIERVHRLHVELFAGGAGRIVVGIGGLLSLTLSATGLALWWKSRAGVWPRSAYDWHRQVGILAFLPLGIIALSGCMLIFRPFLLPVWNRFTGPMPLEIEVKSTGDHRLSAPTLDEIRDRAIRAYPDATITRIYLPEGPDGTFAARLRLPEEGNPHGNTALKFDRYSGEILQRHSSRGSTTAQKILWYSAYPWHTGDALGSPGRRLVALSGWAPAFLFATGLSLWWKRSRRARIAS